MIELLTVVHLQQVCSELVVARSNPKLFAHQQQRIQSYQTMPINDSVDNAMFLCNTNNNNVVIESKKIISI